MIRGLPEVGGQVAISSLERLEGRLCKVGRGSCVTARASEAIRNASEGHHLLHDWGADNARASRGRDQAGSH